MIWVPTPQVTHRVGTASRSRTSAPWNSLGGFASGVKTSTCTTHMCRLQDLEQQWTAREGWVYTLHFVLTSSPASRRLMMRLRNLFFIPDVWENGEGSTKMATRRALGVGAS